MEEQQEPWKGYGKKDMLAGEAGLRMGTPNVTHTHSERILRQHTTLHRSLVANEFVFNVTKCTHTRFTRQSKHCHACTQAQPAQWKHDGQRPTHHRRKGNTMKYPYCNVPTSHSLLLLVNGTKNIHFGAQWPPEQSPHCDAVCQHDWSNTFSLWGRVSGSTLQ